MKQISFSKLALIVCLLCAAMILLIATAFAQPSFGFHLEYSAKYHKTGGGFDGGYRFGNNYFGADTHIYFTNQRNVPVEVGLHYGYNIGSFQPFITTGYYTCGGEAVREKEGIQGFNVGGGISYKLRNSPLKFTTGTTGNNIYLSVGLIKELFEKPEIK